MSESDLTPQPQPSRSVMAGNKKSARPPALKKVSYSIPLSTSSAKLGSPRKEQTIIDTAGVEAEHQDMTACFPQYCAMCEEQISTPNHSVLYCSEACRRKDSIKPLSASILPPSVISPTSPIMSSPPKQILTPRTPIGVDTLPRMPSSSPPVVRIPTVDHGFRSDLDPTEWKPSSSRARAARPPGDRKNSEAYRFLSKFHNSISEDRSTDGDITEIKFHVPPASTGNNTPSLGNSPTTVATTSSSWSTSMHAGYGGSMASTYGAGIYTVDSRPIRPRHNRWYSSSHVGGSGIDLVTPHIPPPVTYEKQLVARDGPMQSGLGSFFGSVEH